CGATSLAAQRGVSGRVALVGRQFRLRSFRADADLRRCRRIAGRFPINRNTGPAAGYLPRRRTPGDIRPCSTRLRRLPRIVRHRRRVSGGPRVLLEGALVAAHPRNALLPRWALAGGGDSTWPPGRWSETRALAAPAEHGSGFGAWAR